MRVEAAVLHEVSMRLRAPFRTSFGVQEVRRLCVVEVRTDEGIGWAECAAKSRPDYSAEYLGSALDVLQHHLVPAVLGLDLDDPGGGGDVAGRCAWVKGHRMAKAALELAVLDAWLTARGRSLAAHLGAVRTEVACGVSVGIAPSVAELVAEVEGYVEAGYQRVKLKVSPAWAAEPVTAVRRAVGDAVELQVDANASFDPGDAGHNRSIDDMVDQRLTMVEQPFAADDLDAHAALAARLHGTSLVCLDESVTDLRSAARALALGAATALNVKPPRVGGYLDAARVVTLCAAAGIPAWCGGMLETGLGRAANLAIAALPGCTLPGDTSASDRYWFEDLTHPFVLSTDGTLAVPDEPGIGRRPDPERMVAWTTRATEVR